MLRVLSAAALAVAAHLALVDLTPVLARQTATLTLAVKNSTAYASPTETPIPAALLVVTPSWTGTQFKTLSGGSEVPGQTLFVSELAVVLSSRAADCDSVFALGPPESDKDFLIVAGRTEAYLPRREWKSTSVGKVFASADDKTTNHLAVQSFSVSIQGAGLKKMVAKDGLGGGSRLVLDQADGKWTADIALKADDVTAGGKLPLTACPTQNRSKNQVPPLLGERRMVDAVRSH
jgi:hypothetical protein